jgi:hypothetical protein
MGNLCCGREHSVQFFVQFFFTQLNCTFSLRVCGTLYTCVFCVDKVVTNLQNPCDKPAAIITWKRFNQRAWQRCIKPGRGQPLCGHQLLCFADKCGGSSVLIRGLTGKFQCEFRWQIFRKYCLAILQSTSAYRLWFQVSLNTQTNAMKFDLYFCSLRTECYFINVI